MNKTNNNRTQKRRLYKTFCSHKRRGKWPFVEVCKGTKAVPLPLLCASFFSQKKGQLPVFPTKSRWLFESKYIEHAVCRSSCEEYHCKQWYSRKSPWLFFEEPRAFLSGFPTFFRKESMQRFARGFAPLTPAAYSTTRQSEQSSVAVEGGAV